VHGGQKLIPSVTRVFSRGRDWSEADILRSYPNLAAEDNHACLKYASAVMRSEKVYPVAPR
jgi:uncharacterized protein (DUF433 family)